MLDGSELRYEAAVHSNETRASETEESFRKEDVSPEERWLPVVGFEGFYEVSDLGRIRRRGAAQGATDGRILRPLVTKTGYLRVSLGRGSPRINKACLVHVIVARAFHGPAPSDGHEVNHLDGIKTNPAASNLEWVTRRENLRHSYRTGLRPAHGDVAHWNPDDLPWDPAIHGVDVAARANKPVNPAALASAVLNAAEVRP